MGLDILMIVELLLLKFAEQVTCPKFHVRVGEELAPLNKFKRILESKNKVTLQLCPELHLFNVNVIFKTSENILYTRSSNN